MNDLWEYVKNESLLQVVSFCDVFLRYTDAKTVLCIMPINTLQNWLAEFNMWLPVDPSTSPYSSQGDIQPRTFPLFVLNDMQKSMVARGKVRASTRRYTAYVII